MDSGFVDLDILLTRIRHAQSKVYFLDAVKAYKAGALRASLTAAWVALVYDLIVKYRELSALGDAAATAFIQSWDNATNANDVRRLLQLEATIIEDASVNTQIVNRIAQTHLERIREDRNFCAHPAFSAEAELFEPSPELVRLHLVNAVDLVLSREPLQGNAILSEFDKDVQSIGFPAAHALVLDYFQQRYLQRARPQNIRNFGTVLAKSLLNGTPPRWENERDKITSSLAAIRDRAPSSWPDVAPGIIRLIDTLEPERRLRAVSFITAFPDFWPLLQQPTRTALQQTIEGADRAALINYRIFDGVRIPHFRDSLLRVIAVLDRDELANAIAVQPLADLWPRAVDIYEQSSSYRTSEANFRNLIKPFAEHLGSEQYDRLLDAVANNGENWDAADTPGLLLGLLRAAVRTDWPTYGARNRFHQRLHHVNCDYRYGDVLALLRDDGWVAPVPEQEDDN